MMKSKKKSENTLRQCKWKHNASKPMHTCMLSCYSHVRLCVTLWTVACQIPLSMGFSKQEYWSGWPCPSPGDLPNPGNEALGLLSLLHWQSDSLPLSHLGSLTLQLPIYQLHFNKAVKQIKKLDKKWSKDLNRQFTKENRCMTLVSI